MKKLFLFSVAALAFCACSNDTVVSDSNSTIEPKEISFTPLTKPNTRAADTYQYAISGTTFPTDLNMFVAAYQVTPTAIDYFNSTHFIYKSAVSKWGGETAKYWPLSAAHINFLAYANLTGTAKFGDQLEPAVASASKAVVTQIDNSTTQTDLIYAIGSGEVTQSSNALSFPTQVDMQFKHAQAWIDFYVIANDDNGTNITVNSITLNGAKYAGTYTITHTNYASTTGQSVAGSWTLLGDAQNIAVPGWSPAALTTSLVHVGKGLLIVPDDDSDTADWTTFTVNYTLDGKSYSYIYTPTTANEANVDQAKHYTFNISFGMHEILVAPTVTNWTDYDFDTTNDGQQNKDITIQ